MELCTMTEKLVSLLRCSLANDYIPELTAKIRHFYDLHYLLHDQETALYLNSETFKADFSTLFVQDQERFNNPEGWQNKVLTDSPFIKDFQQLWQYIRHIYLKELPDLAYKDIPAENEIEESIVTIIQHPFIKD